MMQDAAAKRVGGPAQLVGTATTDRYARPLLEEEARCRQSDAAAPAGDQYGPVLQIAHAGLSPSRDDVDRELEDTPRRGLRQESTAETAVAAEKKGCHGCLSRAGPASGGALIAAIRWVRSRGEARPCGTG